MAQHRKIRLLIADDHPVLRSGVKALLADTEIKVVAEAATGQAAVKQALQQEADVVLMDICMPEGDGLTALGRIKLDKPTMPVVMYSAFDNPRYVARAVAMGASGFLSKGCTRKELVNAIMKAATGETVFTRDELRCVAGAMSTPRILGNIEVPLTQREAQVLRELANGQTNEEIAQTLHINYETVKEHVKRLLSKIGVVDRTQAALWAVRKKLA